MAIKQRVRLAIVVGMKILSCSSASSNSMGTCNEMEVKCHHKIDSKLRIVKSCSKCWKKFYECYDFHKRTSRTNNIVDQKSRYRSHRECVDLARIEYPNY